MNDPSDGTSNQAVINELMRRIKGGFSFFGRISFVSTIIFIFFLVNVIYFSMRVWDFRQDVVAIRGDRDERISAILDASKNTESRVSAILSILNSPNFYTDNFIQDKTVGDCLNAARSVFADQNFKGVAQKRDFAYAFAETSEGVVNVISTHCLPERIVLTYGFGYDSAYLNHTFPTFTSALKDRLRDEPAAEDEPLVFGPPSPP